MKPYREPVEVGKAVWKSSDCRPEQKTDEESEAQKAQLQECESILQRAKDAKLSYVEQGKVLLKICDGRLYKAKHYTSFETYCHEEWGFTRQWAYKLIQAFETAEKLPPEEQPKNERQARELRRQKREGGSEQNPNGTPKEEPPTRTEKEELFYKIETRGMELNILLRKLTEDGDRKIALGRIAPVCEWINMVEEEAI